MTVLNSPWTCGELHALTGWPVSRTTDKLAGFCMRLRRAWQWRAWGSTQNRAAEALLAWARTLTRQERADPRGLRALLPGVADGAPSGCVSAAARRSQGTRRASESPAAFGTYRRETARQANTRTSVRSAGA